VTEALEALSH